MKILFALALLLGLFVAGPALAQRGFVTMSETCTVAAAPAGSQCGTIRVPEDRARRAGRLLSLRFVIVPASPGAPPDPIFYIAGGPGESAVEGLALVMPTLRSVDSERAVVFLDQRGTGESNPLRCDNGLDLVGALSDAAGLGQCAATLRERADLDRYSSLEAVADLEDLRAALGYPRLNLVGVSYGVRVALLYMREHPQRVRSAILRSAYPLDYNIIAEGAAAGDSALAQILDDCESDAACRQAFPGLSDQLRTIEARLAANPIDVTADGADGHPVQVQVTADLFEFLLVVMMQATPSRQYIPLLIATAATSGFQPFATPLLQVRQGLSDFPVGMYLSVLCAEDAPRVPPATPVLHTPLSDAAARLRQICSRWPVSPAASRALEPFGSDVPTMIISGTLDPVTPPQAAARLAASLSHATYVVLPATAHGPMFPECVRPAVATFIRTAAATASGEACATLALPPFATPPSAQPAAAPAPAPVQARPGLQGTWDLEWQTRRGPSPGGYLVIRQNGADLDAELHGRGSIRATGSIEGSRFTLRGERLFVPYTLDGELSGDRIEGALKVMSIERHFVGRRRAESAAEATRP